MHVHKLMHDLKFNVAQLLREEIGSRRSYAIAEETFPLDETLALRQLQGTVRFTRSSTGVLVDVDAQAVVEMPCTRCLNPASQQLKLRFRDQFHSKIDVNTGVALPRPDEEDPFFIDEVHKIDLAEAIRQRALIEMPMRMLCRPDCQGLCPVCGVDLNVEVGHVHAEEVDDRFAALKALLDQQPD